MSEKPETLGDALPAEMARVRDQVLPEYDAIPAGKFAAMMMRQSLDAAAKSLAECDIAAMMVAYEDLKDYSL